MYDQMAVQLDNFTRVLLKLMWYATKTYLDRGSELPVASAFGRSAHVSFRYPGLGGIPHLPSPESFFVVDYACSILLDHSSTKSMSFPLLTSSTS